MIELKSKQARGLSINGDESVVGCQFIVQHRPGKPRSEPRRSAFGGSVKATSSAGACDPGRP